MSENIVIVGGGLSGIFAKLRFERSGLNPILIDKSLPQAKGALGGFAKFSGAKFSLLPAGKGLVGPAGGRKILEEKINEVVNELKLEPSSLVKSNGLKLKQDASSLGHREYDSYVLTPKEINSLISSLEAKVNTQGNIEDDEVISVKFKNDIWEVNTKSGRVHEAKAIFFAGGRSKSDLLREAGAKPTNLKGLDVGIRVEFKDKNQAKLLRNYGPDAKFLLKNCRTFCLNWPGEVYHYDFEGVSIPGGVVAEGASSQANFGILCRTPEKEKLVRRVKFLLRSDLSFINGNYFEVREEALGRTKSFLSELYGCKLSENIDRFCKYLESENLISWKGSHRIYMPLLDWYWDTYSINYSFKTSMPNLFALGDVSGHARGLLQACLSGWIAAEEYLNENL